MRNTKKKSSRKVYDANYYKAQIMLRDPWFIEKIAWLKKRFQECGCPLLVRGFKKQEDYFDWHKTFWRRHMEMQKDPECLEAKLRITGNKESISSEEFYAFEDFKEKFLPPVYGYVFDEILEHFSIAKNDRGFQDFLEEHLFFNMQEYPTTFLWTIWKRNEETDKFELFIKIEPHTKLIDIERHWPKIVQEQKYFPNFSGKNKEWKEFARDVEVYNFYKNLRKQETKRRDKYRGIDIEIYSEMHRKYPELTTNSIRTIVARTRKRLGEI